MEREQVLNDLYRKINETICDGKLPVAIFRVTKGAKTWSGWNFESVPHSGTYVIKAAAANLEGPVSQIYADLFHQIVHILNAENEIRDTSKQGQYHKKEFKSRAESLGLMILNKKDGYGFTHVIVPDELIKKVDYPGFEEKLKKAIEEDIKRIANWRQKETIYYCPVCNQMARADLKSKFFCGYCNVEMIRKE